MLGRPGACQPARRSRPIGATACLADRGRQPIRRLGALFPAVARRPVLFLNDRSCIVLLMPRPREFEPDDVLDSAMREFWERGYRATSVDDLVRATGVKPGSLYGAFPGGKHALLIGSLERYSKLVVPQKLGELENEGASVEHVRAYFDGLVRDLLSPEGRQGCLLVNSAIENAAVDDEVAAVVRGHLARLERCFTDALRTAIARGEIPASVDPVTRAKGLVATSQGLMVVGKANPDEEVLRTIVDNAFIGLS
jgi:TetR/AcrR family transcriptional regulator, transcriptional repressor for nem operon